jgi:NDP-sugar pyrophosphorylase family protein
MIDTTKYLQKFKEIFPTVSKKDPWEIVESIQLLLNEQIQNLNNEYVIKNNIAIHVSAKIEAHAIIKGPAIISANCFIAAHAYLRGGVFLGEKVTLGPGCEVKSSVILDSSALAHFNFVGDSLLGSYVNIEAGAVIANHYNEREDKTIFVMADDKCVPISAKKFGALVGDYTRIGANAVLSPGTILLPRSVVKRLALVEQCK